MRRYIDWSRHLVFGPSLTGSLPRAHNCTSPQEQYTFIHDVVLESVTCGDTQISAKDLKFVITRLREKDQITGKTQFETQFEVCAVKYNYVNGHPMIIQWSSMFYTLKFQVLNQVTSDPNKIAKNELKKTAKNHLLDHFSCESPHA